MNIDNDTTETLIRQADDAMLVEDFESEYGVTTADVVFDAHVSTGRDWESQETDDGGHTVRSTPDPNVVVYHEGVDSDTALVALRAGPVVVYAFRTSLATSLVEKLIADLEGWDGIEHVRVEHVADGYDSLVASARDGFDGAVPDGADATFFPTGEQEVPGR